MVKNAPIYVDGSATGGAIALLCAFAAAGCASGVDEVASPLSHEAGPYTSPPDAEVVADADLSDDEPTQPWVCDGPPPLDRDLPGQVETATFALG